jgi:hypothetical protein
MNAWEISFTYDGEILSGKSQPTQAGAQDLGLPNHGTVRRTRIGAGDPHGLAVELGEMLELFVDDLAQDANVLQAEREQCELFDVGPIRPKPVYVRRVRGIVLGGRR